MDLVLDAVSVFEQLHREHPREPSYLYALAAAHWTKGEVVETTMCGIESFCRNFQQNGTWRRCEMVLLVAC